VNAYYADHFILPLPSGHRFPMAKYGRLRERLTAELPQVRLGQALPASDGELALVHNPAYISAIDGKTSLDGSAAPKFSEGGLALAIAAQWGFVSRME